jgi:hypothetical protein
MTATELFLMYREYRLTFSPSALPECYREPHPYEHFLTVWKATHRPEDLAAPRMPTAEDL